MKRLNKTQAARHEELTAKLVEANDDLNAAIKEFNAKIHALREALAPKADAANAIIREANAFVEEIHGEQENYESERSDNWRDGDAGSAYQDWMSSWELEIDDLTLEAAPQFDEVVIDTDEFEALEQEVPS